MRYPITPVAKPRQTRADKWQRRPAVLRYRRFADQCRAQGMTLPVVGARVLFELPMPGSWSAKRRAAMAGQPHQQKPDLDNLIKALLDALHDDDSGIWALTAEKRWSTEGAITISREATS